MSEHTFFNSVGKIVSGDTFLTVYGTVWQDRFLTVYGTVWQDTFLTVYGTVWQDTFFKSVRNSLAGHIL